VTENHSEQLVSGPFPVKFSERGPSPRPGLALVFSLQDGKAVVLADRPSGLAYRRYRYGYEVMITDQRLRWEEMLQSRAAGYPFSARLQATWRVTSPAAVVERGILDVRMGHEVVKAGLLSRLIPECRTFDIEDCAKAEKILKDKFGNSDLILAEGITVSNFTLQLDLDAEAEGYLRRTRGLDWDEEIAIKERRNKTSEAVHAGDIQTMEEEHGRKIRQARAKALRAAAKDEGGLIIELIAQDPSQLWRVLQEMSTRQDMDLQLKMQVFQKLVDNKLIQPADVDNMWQTIFHKPRMFGLTTELPAASDRSMTEASAPAVEKPDIVLSGDDVVSSTDDGPSESAENSGAAEAGRRRQDGVTGWRPVRDRRPPGGSEKAPE
jgi:hypothetical protein